MSRPTIRRQALERPKNRAAFPFAREQRCASPRPGETLDRRRRRGMMAPALSARLPPMDETSEQSLSAGPLCRVPLSPAQARGWSGVPRERRPRSETLPSFSRRRYRAQHDPEPWAFGIGRKAEKARRRETVQNVAGSLVFHLPQGNDSWFRRFRKGWPGRARSCFRPEDSSMRNLETSAAEIPANVS